ncbi:MAG: hypothetical protein KKF27_21885, partial [Gammaproteobacteria bacterium]|nr:hypothetical protein [Gammaproteobacteria bacterium]
KTLLSRIPGLNDFCKEGENFPTVEFFWDVKTEEGDTENIVFSVAFPKEIKEFILADEAYKLVLEIQELEEDFWYNKQGEEEGVGISTHSTVEERIDMTHLLLSYRSGCIQCDDFDKLLTFGKPKVSEKTMQELKEYKTHLESELSNSAEVADATEVAIAVSTD